MFHRYHLIFIHINLTTLPGMAKEELRPLPAPLKERPPKLTCSGSYMCRVCTWET